MKKPSLFFLPLVAAVASHAQAETDVKLYGKIDLAAAYTKNPGASAVVDMQNQTSRVGLLIREDLNPQWAVKAYLENGFNADDGSLAANDVIFNRRSILAVYNETFGEIGFGRMGSVQSISSPYGIGLPSVDPFRTAYGPAYEIEGSFGGDGRANNAVTWLSNKMKGFRVGLTYSLSADADEQTTSKNNRLISFAANYEIGKWFFAAGASQFRWGKINTMLADASKTEAAKFGHRKNSTEAFAGLRYNLTDSTILYLAAQYMHNWRNFAYWRPSDSSEAKPNGGNPNGLNAWSCMTGFRHKFTGSLTWVGSFGWLEGSMKDAKGVKTDGERLRAATALEYSITKSTGVYAAFAYGRNSKGLVSYSKGRNLYTGMVGMMHWF